jgi:biopolymer transport protein ExbB/TolQ
MALTSELPTKFSSVLRLRALPYLVALAITLSVILAGSVLLPKDSPFAIFLFDHSTKSFFSTIYPFTIQNAMYLMIGIGFADLWVRYRTTLREEYYLSLKLLPDDQSTILQIDDLGPIRRRVSSLEADEDSFLPQLIDLSILQLFTSRSLDQTVEIFTSMLELMSHRLDLAYQTMRFLVWIIPTSGFIGTVVGISIALEGMQDPKNISFEKVTSGLAVAFYTTILALLLSAILVLLQNIVQRREETVLNRAAQYCLKNLINRIYTGK